MKWAITMSHVLCNYTVYLGNGRRWAQCDCGSAVTTSVVLGLTISVPDLLCISCVGLYGKIFGQLALFQIWGPRPSSTRSPSKYDYNNTQFIFVVCRNVVVGIEQSLIVFLHRKTTSRPFKLTSEMELFFT